MTTLHAVLLMSEESGARLCRLANAAGISLKAEVVGDLPALIRAFDDPPELLLSFGTSVIVPAPLLELPRLLALNVHAASPDYPGRDPHHFAIYDGATKYGATMHYMTQSVDAGPIVDAEVFDVSKPVSPSELLAQANEAGWLLIARFFRRFAEQGAPAPVPSLSWGARKSTRRMFQELCRIDPAMPSEEVERRLKATAMPGYRNLYIDLHGYRFRIEDFS